MTPTQRRTGRPAQFVTDMAGTPVHGLSAMARKRYGKVVAYRYYATYSKPRVTFGTDKAVAIQRFTAWQAKQDRHTVEFVTSEPLTLGGMELSCTSDVPTAALGEWLREQLLSKAGAHELARITGIDALEWLHTLLPPAPAKAASLRDALAHYLRYKRPRFGANPFKNKAAVGRIRREWFEFMATVAVDTLAEVTPAMLRAYQNKVRNRLRMDKDGNAKTGRTKQGADLSIAVVIQRWKTVCNYTSEVDLQGHKEFKELVANVKRERVKLVSNTYAIPVADYRALLEFHQDNPYNTAALLYAMNACAYAADLTIVEFDQIDYTTGDCKSFRSKNSQPMRCKLWARTLKAIEALPRHSKFIFGNPYSRKGSAALGAQRKGHNLYCDIFLQPNVPVKLPKGVAFSSLRDGAYTFVSDEFSVSHAMTMAGHSKGIAEHYHSVSLKTVAAACEALERYYLGA